MIGRSRFVTSYWQRIASPRVTPIFGATLDDFHAIATALAKIDHFFECDQAGVGSAVFVTTELEYLHQVVRGYGFRE
jgi:hypothetical protein